MTMSSQDYRIVPVEDSPSDGKVKTNCPTTSVIALIALTICIFFLGGIALGYYIRHVNYMQLETTPQKEEEMDSPWSPLNVHARHKTFLNGDSSSYMTLYEELKNASSKPKSENFITDNDDIVNYVWENFDSNLDKCERQVCHHQTTRPHPELTNRVLLLDKNETVLLEWRSKAQNENLSINGTKSEEEEIVNFQPYVAGSAAGKVKGDVLFLNYGLEADFDLVMQSGLPLEDRIALVRTRGDQSLANKVDLAQQHNMTAMLVYQDPDDEPMTPECGDSVPVLSLYSLGDKAMGMTSIPVQTIPCVMARALLQRLTGRKAPQSWRNHGYITHIGRVSTKPGPWLVEVEVNNVIVNRTLTSLIGTIHGRDDPEHYIFLGVNRQALTPGGQSARLRDTTMLLNIATDLNQMIKRAMWLPKRTIKLCSWAGQEGMAKYFQDNYEVLANKVVAYVSLDQLRFGEDTLDGEGSVGLIGALRSAADMVPDHRYADETVYDSWFYSTGESPVVGEADDTVIQEPNSLIQKFFYTRGIPFLQPKYVSLADFATERSVVPPLEEQIPPYKADVNDQNLNYIHTLTKVAGLTVLKLADWRVVNYDLVAMAKMLNHDTSEVAYTFGLVLPSDLSSALESSASELVTGAESLDYFLGRMFDPDNQLLLRRINEKLLHFGNTALKVKNMISDMRKLSEEEPEPVTEAATELLYYLRSLNLILHINGI